ncbi:oligosaccharyl transferase beta subunit precursor [Suhomyces tanzawaensis NRRL Y-17324]|uniref:Dolichyl-diphosphooligosaccharide--protein glycosyltransferase subunit WBP1 n=1 Tax=Suhomyces tanzawaensis NRRL Y-17324 TaxID=984487 RepID=A0A1E4SPA7_9ASCO|nr:oligosaccharyl transferase beta subunit precursor [Suhomyces tanzawaensis NRRL Y-17324]ODV81335.1 oligosaccharyl transferase beta subunit precursor [Suhomyces tanzawaensis NRRL Y-17324]
MIRLTWLFAVVCFAASVLAAAAATPDALVLFDPQLHDLLSQNSTSSLSKFISNLELQYKVTVKSYDDEDIKLLLEDDLAYDNLVLLPSSKKAIAAKQAVSQGQLLKYINAHGNVLVVGDATSVLPESTRVFLNELGIYPSPKNFRYQDHFHTSDSGKVALAPANVVAGNNVISQLSTSEYDGGAALISNNELIIPLVQSSKTGFTAGNKEYLDEDTTWTFGEQGFLAVGLQALNNARVAWVGSESLLENELVQWVFQQKGVLKLQFVHHSREENPAVPDPSIYRVKEQALYTIGVSEWVDGKWAPYTVSNPENNLQVEFKMLDPYQRLDLKPLGPAASVDGLDVLDTQVYSVQFTVPDQHGMFTFGLDYKRSGLSYLEDSKVVTVRHLANDEYKRSWDITNSWLYVASAGLVVVAWFAFVVNYIYVGKTNAAKKNI